MKAKKARNKREARKRAVRQPEQIEEDEAAAKRDSMSASKRKRGVGLPL